MLRKLCLIFILINYNYKVFGDDCLPLKKELANAQKDFILCATRNSVPVQVCTQCIDRYMLMEQFYNETATICYNDYFDQDRLNVVQRVQEAVTRIWIKAFCDECSDSQKTFSEKYDNYVTCINKQTSEEACTKCLYQYTKLNNFYTSLYQENNGNVCFDLQDQMNRTRRQWSKTFKCSPHPKQHGSAFIMMVITVISIVAAFYVAAYNITIYQERNNHHILLDGPSTSSLLSNNGETATTRNVPRVSKDSATTTNYTEKSLAANGLHSIGECNDGSSSFEDDITMLNAETKPFMKM